MNVAQLLATFIGTAASIITFCVMRFPHYRRPQFRTWRACSLLESLAGAGFVFAWIVFLILVL